MESKFEKGDIVYIFNFNFSKRNFYFQKAKIIKPILNSSSYFVMALSDFIQYSNKSHYFTTSTLEGESVEVAAHRLCSVEYFENRRKTLIKATFEK